MNTPVSAWLNRDREMSIRGTVGDNVFVDDTSFTVSDVVSYSINASLGVSGVSVGNATSTRYTLELDKTWHLANTLISHMADPISMEFPVEARIEIGISVNGTMQWEKFGVWKVMSVTCDPTESTIVINGEDIIGSNGSLICEDRSDYGVTSIGDLAVRVGRIVDSNVVVDSPLSAVMLDYDTNQTAPDASHKVSKYRPLWGGIADELPCYKSEYQSMLRSVGALSLTNARVGFDGKLNFVQPKVKAYAITGDHYYNITMDRTRWFTLKYISLMENKLSIVKESKTDDEGVTYYEYRYSLSDSENSYYVTVSPGGSYINGNVLELGSDSLNTFTEMVSSTWVSRYYPVLQSSTFPFLTAMDKLIECEIEYEGVPDILPGDIVQIVDLDNVTHKVFATDVKYEFSGGFRSTITGSLNAPMEKVYDTSDPIVMS